MIFGKLKEYKALITFDSWSDSLAAERVFEKLDCPYSPIPSPRSISLECNFAICFPLEKVKIIEEFIKNKVSYNEVYEVTEAGFKLLKEVPK